MSLWSEPGMPHKGWVLEGVDDLEDLIGACEWCGTSLRYAHHLSHPDGYRSVAGCSCAEKLTEDYTNPRRIEKALKRRNKWLISPRWKYFVWRWNSGIDAYRGDDEIAIKKENNKYRIWIRARMGLKLYNSVDDAKKAAFDALYIKGWRP